MSKDISNVCSPEESIEPEERDSYREFNRAADIQRADDAVKTTIQLRPIAGEPEVKVCKPLNQSQKADMLIDMLEQFVNKRPHAQATGDTNGRVKIGAKSTTPSAEKDGFMINWNNFSYVVESNRSLWRTGVREKILDNLTGSFRSGEFSAVLGPSGAGKSTLIRRLIGKRVDGITGQTKLTFNNPKSSGLRRPFRIATIPQRDYLLDTLTVLEAFMFASQIKNAHLIYSDQTDDNLSASESLKTIDGEELSLNNRDRKPFDHKANVHRVLEQLNLRSCTNIRCGNLSGGQYKRVSIGLELLSRPDLMILDEPTSGLDSITSLKTIKTLRKLVSSSGHAIAIVAIIHQPDIEMFNLFHKAYVLASGGRAIYDGPTDGILEAIRLGIRQVAMARSPRHVSVEPEADELISMLSDRSLHSLEEQLSGRSVTNPARLIVEVAAGEYGTEIIDAMASFESKATRFDQNCCIDNMTGNGQPVKVNGSQGTLKKLLPVAHSSQNEGLVRLDKRLIARNVTNYNGSVRVYLRHVALQTKRSWITSIRDPMLLAMQLIIHILVPLFMSYAYINQSNSNGCLKIGPIDLIEEAYKTGDTLEELRVEIREVFENLGYMFVQVYAINLTVMCLTSLTYPLVVQVLVKEHRNGWYSMSSYFVGKTLADIPVPSVDAIIAITISYHLTGQSASAYSWRFAGVALMTVLITLIGQTQGLMFGAMLMESPQSAVFFSAASTVPHVLVCGFILRIQKLPQLLQTLSKFSYLTHFLDGFVILRYGFGTCPCEEQKFAVEPTHQVPQKFRVLLDNWVNSFATEYSQFTNEIEPHHSHHNNTTQSIDLIDRLMNILSRARTSDHKITSCDKMSAYAMLDHELDDSHLSNRFISLLVMLIIYKLLAFRLLSWKINRYT